MEVSFRPALTFPHTPARSPLAPESSREPNPAPLRLAALSPRPAPPPTPSAVHRALASSLPLSPPLCPKAPRQIHSQPRTHLEFPL
ncbi:hypothetical protein ALC62_05977 [Cyphomyrmex costatus]|uniref:Uncharacterized protein n=1 Tax=Cyphomyrmex costatus TaxID=456900 RepID=A0A195CR40_9HYME|nr:hypothetical protein ALC62_05977 [Cyphomyrmex costatus]